MATFAETAQVARGEAGKRVVTSVCGICPGGCGVDVERVDGKIEVKEELLRR